MPLAGLVFLFLLKKIIINIRSATVLFSSLLHNNISIMEIGSIYMAEIMKNLNIIFHIDNSNNDKLNNDKETGEHILTLIVPSLLNSLFCV